MLVHWCRNVWEVRNNLSPFDFCRHIAECDTLTFARHWIHIIADAKDSQDYLCLRMVTDVSASTCCGSEYKPDAHPIVVCSPVIVSQTALNTTCTLLALVRDCMILLTKLCRNPFRGE